MRIQHNIMAMNAYRNYNLNNKALSGNLEKLSSGYKINRAGDDAAGLAISEKMRAQITGLNAAQKNVKDGISLVKTAEGAMQEIQDMLNRMDYLATQSANGTYQDEVDREALQQEVDSLREEINRIADSANFNGIKLLDGSLDTSFKTTGETDLFDVEAPTAGALTIVSDGQLGNNATAGVYELDLTDYKATASAAPTVTVFGQTIAIKKGGTGAAFKKDEEFTGEDVAASIAASFKDVGATGSKYADNYGTGFKIEAKADGSKVTFTMNQAPTKPWQLDSNVTFANADNNATKQVAGTTSGNQAQGVQLTTITEPVDSSAGRRYAMAALDLKSIKDQIADGSTLTIGDTTYTFAVGKGSAYKDGKNVIDLTDMTAETLETADAGTLGKIAGRITTAAKDNKNFYKVTSNTQLDKTGASTTAAHKAGVVYLTEREGGVDTDNYKLEGTDNSKKAQDGDWSGLVKLGKVDTAGMGKAMNLQIGDSSDSFNQMKVVVGDMHTNAMGGNGKTIADINIGTSDGAQAAVNVIKDAINYVSSVRGQLGAYQNRLDHTANNLSVMAENIQDAESTIRDTDVAEEMMSYVKNNILVQSAQAMLAQANQVPQGVLQLLG